MPLLEIFRDVWGVLSSRLGQLGLVALLAFGWGHHNASTFYEHREAEARAALEEAHRQELTREREASAQIVAEAARRANEDAVSARSMQEQIDELNKRESHAVQPIIVKGRAVCPPSSVDSDLAERVRRLDTSGAGAPTPPRRPR